MKKNVNCLSVAVMCVLALVPAVSILAAAMPDYAARVKAIEEGAEKSADYVSGKAEAEAIMRDEKAPGAIRLRAATYLATGLVDAKDDYEGADRIYLDFAELAKGKLGANEQAQLLGCRVNLLVIRRDQKAALQMIEDARAEVAKTGNAGYVKLMNDRYDDCVRNVYGAFFDRQGEFDYWMKAGKKARAFACVIQGKVSEPARDIALAKELVAEATSAAAAREPWVWLWSRDEAFCRETFDKAAGTDARDRGSLAQALQQTVVRGGGWYGANPCSYYQNWPVVTRTWDVYKTLVDGLGQKAPFAMAQYAAIAFAAVGDKAKAAAIAKLGLEDPNIKPDEAYELKLMGVILTLEGSETERAEKLRKADEVLRKDCPVDAVRKRFERAGATAVVCGDERLLRAVVAYYNETHNMTLPRKSYTVRFSEREIGGAGDWGNLPFKPEESPFDRQFGSKEMAFMVTDVATGDRGQAATGGVKARQYPNTLQVAADEWGIHFVQTFYDARARQFESGELDAGSYECYVAPGENMPYLSLLCYPKKDKLPSVMNMTYLMPGHRRLDAKDPREIRSGVRFTDGSVITYFALSWDLFADHVPVDGGEWEFESVFWGPIPSAWNGTKTIHGRSTWGKLRFELGEAARIKILRAQLFKAVAQYRQEKQPGASSDKTVQEGVFEHWSDKDLGDPVFYDARLKGLVAELDAVADRVKVGMSDADVKDVAENFFPKFRDLRANVSRLRAEYLKERLLVEGGFEGLTPIEGL